MDTWVHGDIQANMKWVAGKFFKICRIVTGAVLDGIQHIKKCLPYVSAEILLLATTCDCTPLRRPRSIFVGAWIAEREGLCARSSPFGHFFNGDFCWGIISGCLPILGGFCRGRRHRSIPSDWSTLLITIFSFSGGGGNNPCGCRVTSSKVPTPHSHFLSKNFTPSMALPQFSD